MEKTIKQVILSTLFTYLAILLFFTFVIIIFVSLFYYYFSSLAEVIFISQIQTCISLITLLVVFVVYKMYLYIDEEIVEGVQEIVRSIQIDKFTCKYTIQEFNEIEAALIQKNKEILDKQDFLKNTISYISHDMKTPVTVINANVDLIRHNQDITSIKGLDRLDRISNESDKIYTYINTLMDVTMLLNEQRIKEKISLNAFLKRINKQVCIYADMFEEEIPVQINIMESLDTYIMGDLKKYEKCIVHLLNNAFEHRRDKVKIKIVNVQEFICIQVIDDGIGFNQEALEKAKEMFYTSNEARTSGKGIGIGLYFVNTYLESVEGELYLDNAFPYGGIQEMRIRKYKEKV